MGNRILQAMALAMLFQGGLAVAAERTAAPADARLYFISPAHGETVRSPFKVRFGAQRIGVAPAGVGVEATGHHHLIIDGTLPAMDQPIPSNETYRHFGGGQTEAVIELEPGEHTLQMLMGDRNHVPHRPVVASPRITINVE